jgi:hypothetical protein
VVDTVAGVPQLRPGDHIVGVGDLDLRLRTRLLREPPRSRAAAAGFGQLAEPTGLPPLPPPKLSNEAFATAVAAMKATPDGCVLLRVRRLAHGRAPLYDEALRVLKPHVVAHSHPGRLRAAVVDLLRQERYALSYYPGPAKQYVRNLARRLAEEAETVRTRVAAGSDSATGAPLAVAGASGESQLPLRLRDPVDDPLLRFIEAETAVMREGLAKMPSRPGAYPEFLMANYVAPAADAGDDEVEIIASPGAGRGGSSGGRGGGADAQAGAAGAAPSSAGNNGGLTGRKRKAEDVITIDDD